MKDKHGHVVISPVCRKCNSKSLNHHVLYLWRKPQFMEFSRILVHESDLFDRIVQIREDKIDF